MSFPSICRFVMLLLVTFVVGQAGEAGPAGGSIQGGLCVVLGADDPALCENLVQEGSFVVHVLDPDAAKVDALNVRLAGKRLLGRASAEVWNGATLPFADHLVSLLVVATAATIPEGELLRVVRPLGELVMRGGGGWKRTLKPWVDGMDEWTHWRHGADGNMVSKDRLVDVPRRVQWTFGRDVIPERTFAVYAGGRFFAYERDTILARDAFNGMPLWRKPADLGISPEQKEAGYVNLDRLVADGGKVYFASPDGVFQAHDGADAKLATPLPQAGTPLLVRMVKDGAGPGTLVLADQTSVRALDAGSGKLLWKQVASSPMHLVADRDGVYYITGDFTKQEAVEILARDLKTGKELWRRSDFTDPCPWPALAVGISMGYGKLAFELKVPRRWPGGYQKYYEQYPKARKGGIIVLSAKDGSTTTETESGGAAARHGEWNVAYWVNQSLLRNASVMKGEGQRSGIAINPLSDLSKQTVFDDNDVGDRGFGHCYPPTITERFYIYGQLNFTDLKTQQHSANQITRGGCGMRVGYLPANGMLYVHPKHCVCFPMLDGNAALAPAYASSPAPSHPLIKGPAFGAPPAAPSDPARDWPMYRHDSSRTGTLPSEVTGPLKVLWTRDIPTPDYAKDAIAAEWLQHQYLSGIITQPTIAGGMVFVAQPDTHQVVALDAVSGQPKWTFTANGRIDGPPTWYRGLCLFGSRSGWLYAVRASDGQLAWRLRLAPDDRRIAQYGQVESPTPVPGSPVIIDDRLYIGAGLHPQADHGVLVFCIDPLTGAIVWQKGYTSLGYEDREGWSTPRGNGSITPLAASDNPWRTTAVREYEAFDLPVRDGASTVAVSRWQFDLKTGAATLRKTSAFYEVADTGVWMRRRTWSYGPRSEALRTPLAVCSGSAVFTTLQPKGPGARLMRVDFGKGISFAMGDGTAAGSDADKDLDMARLPSTSPVIRYLSLGAKWKVEDGKAAAHGLVCAGSQLFLLTQAGVLETWSTATGAKIGEQRLEKPVFDGLAAAGGRLYLATASGKVICLGR